LALSEEVQRSPEATPAAPLAQEEQAISGPPVSRLSLLAGLWAYAEVVPQDATEAEVQRFRVYMSPPSTPEGADEDFLVERAAFWWERARRVSPAPEVVAPSVLTPGVERSAKPLASLDNVLARARKVVGGSLASKLLPLLTALRPAEREELGRRLMVAGSKLSSSRPWLSFSDQEKIGASYQLELKAQGRSSEG
jgi:hypothetical protein